MLLHMSMRSKYTYLPEKNDVGCMVTVIDEFILCGMADGDSVKASVAVLASVVFSKSSKIYANNECGRDKVMKIPLFGAAHW